jgi:hypothetical protein
MDLVITDIKVVLNDNLGVKVSILIQTYFKSQVHEDGDLKTEPMLRQHFIPPLERIIINIFNN